MTDVLEDIKQETITIDTENGDHDLFAHYVRKEDIIKATFDSIPVKALCGKVWVASKNPEGKQVCPECKDIWETLAVE